MSVAVETFLGCISAMGKIICVFSIAFVAAHKNFLPPDFIRLLSNFCFNYLTPAMVMSNLARKITLELLKTWWTVVIWAIICIITSYVVGYIISKALGIRQEFKSTVITAIAYSNSLNIPLVIMTTLSNSSVFDGYGDVYEISAIFFFIYGVGWNICQYTLGYPYLLGGDVALPQSVVVEPEIEDDDETEATPLPTIMKVCLAIGHIIHLIFSTIWRFLTGWMSWPNWIGPNGRFALSAMATNPFIIGQIIAFIIALVPPLRYQFFTEGTPLRPVMQSIEFISTAPIPISTVITAANIYHSLKRNYGLDARRVMYKMKKISEGEKEREREREHCSLDSLDSSNVRGLHSNNKVVKFDNSNHNNDGAIELERVRSGRGFGNIKVANDSDSDDDKLPQLNSPIHLPTNSGFNNDEYTNDLDSSYINNDDVNERASIYPSHSHSEMGADSDKNPGKSNNSRDNAPLSLNTSSSPYSSHSTTYNMQDDSRVMYKGVMRHRLSIASRPVDNYSSYETNSNTISSNGDSGDDNDDHSLRSRPYRTTSLAEVVMTPSAYHPSGAVAAIIPKPSDDDLEYDEHGVPLPLPRLTVFEMTVIGAGRLIICPIITFCLILLMDKIGLSFFTGDLLFKTSLMLAAAAPTAEGILMILCKASKIRQSMMLSLIYIIQYALFLFTIPVIVTVSIFVFAPSK